jgi:phosphoadenosine phosphosulfate reductase
MLENTSLYWCNTCGVPLLSCRCENCGETGTKTCSDLKPMFWEECKFLEKETGRLLPGEGWQDRLWMRYKTIWFNGRHLLRLSANGKPEVVKEYSAANNSTSGIPIDPDILYTANRSTLDELEKTAVSFVKEVMRDHPSRKPAVSFSGGKDSTVVSYIVRKALETDEVLHLFGNTTIEYPDTLEYVKEFRRRNPRVPFMENSASLVFSDMCRLVGPPSRINAWCCSVFKASPIATIVNRANGQGGIISFEGIRRRESRRRRNRGKLYLNKKIVHQLSAYPILEWREIDVWLFILSKRLTFNKAYEKGFARVGCMYCPNNVPSSDYLIQSYYPSHVQKWFDFLTEYAKEIGKEDPAEYVSSGAWKKRVGKSEGASLVYVKKAPCLKNSNAMHFILDKELNDGFFEWFKPFGNTERFKDKGGDGLIVKDFATNEALFMVKVVKDVDILKRESNIDPSWNLGKEFLCVDLLTNQNVYRIMQTIERQLRKFQVCVSCGACAGICPTSAIKINPHFLINEELCVHCSRCLSTRYIKAGCVSLNSQQQARGYSGVNRI